MGFLGVIARRLDALIGPAIMLVFPLYASLRAIESPSNLDDQQWLTYWIIYSFLTVFELSFYKVLVWFPLWGYMKLLLCAWLVLPMFNGAAYVYEKHVRRYIINNINIGGRLLFSSSSSSSSAAYSDEQKKLLQMMTFDARKAVVQYVDKYGWDSVERAIKAAERETKKH